MHRFTSCLFLVISVLATDTSAEESDRILSLPYDGAGLEGVGRLDMGREGYCTAALVSQDLVLTAAHCVYDDETGIHRDAADLVFSAELTNGRFRARRGVTEVTIHPDYLVSDKSLYDGVVSDLALLKLDSPLDLYTVRPFAVAAPMRAGARVQMVSYARGRSETPLHEHGCTVLERHKDVSILDCDVDFGASGAPVFVQGAQGPRIVAVISSMVDRDGERFALAAPVGSGLARLMSIVGYAPGAKRVRSDGAGGQSIRFIRP